jgi:hypothetical protein
MKGIVALLGATLALGLVGAGVAGADVNPVTPSANALNQASGYAYVSVTTGLRTATLTFHTSNWWYSCFEYRTDGDTGQVTGENGGDNYNTQITDGLYPYTCLSGGTASDPVTASVTVSAQHYVEVRMVFGAETNERFDWTRFDVESCAPVPDGSGLTAAAIGGDVTGTLDATGCNIGAYFDDAHPGSVDDAEILGANYYGVLDNGGSVDVTDSAIHDIGESPLNGAQHGNAIVYAGGASGTISGNTVSRYQKNGITIRGARSAASVVDNVVSGEGPVDYIAQNGIQISDGATALVKGNTVSGNWYTPATWTACGLLFYQAGGVKQQANTLFGNQTDLCNAGRGGGNYNG